MERGDGDGDRVWSEPSFPRSGHGPETSESGSSAAEGKRSPRLVRGALLLVALIAYVLSPLDLLPEAFLGVLGLADDALVVLVGAAIYLAQFREALR